MLTIEQALAAPDLHWRALGFIVINCIFLLFVYVVARLSKPWNNKNEKCMKPEGQVKAWLLILGIIDVIGFICMEIKNIYDRIFLKMLKFFPDGAIFELLGYVLAAIIIGIVGIGFYCLMGKDRLVYLFHRFGDWANKFVEGKNYKKKDGNP
jgi:hypothetical protein